MHLSPIQIIGLIILYLIGCIPAYLVQRYFQKKRTGNWSTADRSWAIFMALISSWLGVVTTVLVAIIPKGDVNEPSKW